MLTARRLGKRYGDKRVLRGIDLELSRGGFLVVTGPNGAGKTTLLRICAGLAQPTQGTIERSISRGQVGYLGHEPLVYRELTALENLDLYGRLYRVAERRERIGMLLERFGLWDVRHDRVASYSRGMTQRLALCRVLLHDPELLIRTSGEQRISNYLLWQLAYSELYFTDVLWPDFSRAHLEAALADYDARQRRFGGR